tara:strand:- start:51 stop:191 length:141 start_codon:yes stop_codon:yes gene_type:complete
MTKFTNITSAPISAINSVHKHRGLTDQDRAKRKARLRRKEAKKNKS